jgi:hypothetical protein
MGVTMSPREQPRHLAVVEPAGALRRSEVCDRTQEALLQATDRFERPVAGSRFQLQHFARETHQGQLHIGVRPIDEDEVVLEIEPPLDLVGGKSRQQLLRGLPQLPLAQGVTQEHEHHLRRHQVERTGMKIGQVVEALELAVTFLDGGAPTIVSGRLLRIGKVLGGEQRPAFLMSIGVGFPHHHHV